MTSVAWQNWKVRSGQALKMLEFYYVLKHQN